MSYPKCILVFVVFLPLSGCVSIGQTAIREGRTEYNNAIHETSAEQTLLNVIRIKHGENAQFLDVSEIDASSNLQTSIVGGPSMIGAASGALGAITGTASYSDAPIVKYTPLSGNPLIEQVSFPISMGSISKLGNSVWPTTILFTAGLNRISDEYLDYFRVIDLISALDQFGALSTDSSKDDNELFIRFDSQGNVPKWAAIPGVDDFLTCAPSEPPSVTTRRLWTALQGIYKQKKDVISWGTKSTTPTKGDKPAIVAPRSAIGALIAIEIAQLSHEEAEAVRQANQKVKCKLNDFYYVGDERRSVSSLWDKHIHNVFYGSKDNPEDIKLNSRELGQYRKFLLVEITDQKPVDAYVSVYFDQLWYSINNKDEISKRNLAFLNQILTIQSIPSAAAPTTQTAITRP